MRFTTIEVGSLPKLPGRASKFKGKSIKESERKQLEEVLDLVPSERLKKIAADYLEIVSKPGKPTVDERKGIIELNSAFNIVLLEEIGLDYVFDGEAHRSEMYAGIAGKVSGLEKLSWQISFINAQGDPNIYKPYSYASSLGLKAGPIHNDELPSILTTASVPVKICVTGAYTMGTWTDPGVLLPKNRKEGLTWTEGWEKSQEQIVSEFARNILNPTLKGITQVTADGKRAVRIQIDEPNATKIRVQDTSEEDLLRRSIQESIEGITGSEFGLHVCFSHDYTPIARVVASIPEIRFVTLEIANADQGDLSNYEKQLRPFIEAGYTGQYCIGVFTVHTDEIESAELIARRARFAAELVGDEKRIELAPDCGLRTRKLPIAVRKLQQMVQAANTLREEVKVASHT